MNQQQHDLMGRSINQIAWMMFSMVLLIGAIVFAILRWTPDMGIEVLLLGSAWIIYTPAAENFGRRTPREG